MGQMDHNCRPHQNKWRANVHGPLSRADVILWNSCFPLNYASQFTEDYVAKSVQKISLKSLSAAGNGLLYAHYTGKITTQDVLVQ